MSSYKYIYNLTIFGSFCILIGVKITSVGMEFGWSKKAKLNHLLLLVQGNKLMGRVQFVLRIRGFHIPGFASAGATHSGSVLCLRSVVG